MSIWLNEKGGMGWDGVRWDGMGWGEMGWDGVKWDGMGQEDNLNNALIEP